jgi:cysteine-rich repeat protein
MWRRASLCAALWGGIAVVGSLWASRATPAQAAPIATSTPVATSTRTETRTPRPTHTPTSTPDLVGDCNHDGAIGIVELQRCVNLFLDEGGDCPACDTNLDGEVGIVDLQAAVNCFLDVFDGCRRGSAYDGICGDGVRQGSEQCDDGNNYGGDGCAANCTLESDLTLNLGSVETSKSNALVQSELFSIPLPITGSQVLTVGARRTRPVQGADGFTNFAPGDLPFAAVVAKNRGRLEPIAVPGLICACIRGVTLQACGGRPVSPADHSKICTLDVFENIDPSVCPANDACKPVFGPGVSLAGDLGCNGTRDLDYDFTLDSKTAAATFSRGGSEVDLGGTALSFDALGFIMDMGSCAPDTMNPSKGADGLPCTDDDDAGAQGQPQVLLLTTGTARASVLNANSQDGKNIDGDSQCGDAECVTSTAGTATTCDDILDGAPAGICMAGALASLGLPATGDIVVPIRYCAVE